MILGFAAAILLSCNDETKNSSIDTPDISFKKEGEAYLLKSGDTLEKITIEFAGRNLHITLRFG